MLRAPRFVLAGLAGDTGKSLVSLGVIRALRGRGKRVVPFKKGPDFIDAAWLGCAAGVACHNLDTFMMPSVAIHRTVARAMATADIGVVEGNRGLFDGLDAEGSHSTATLAKLIGAPVILLVDATKVTRTVAALVLGCRALDPDLEIAGVILNRVATARQEAIIRTAVEAYAKVPVLGAIPKLRQQLLPSRHLGLVTAGEHGDAEAALESAAEEVAKHVDLDAIVAVAEGATSLVFVEQPSAPAKASVRIGILKDAAFSFYYPENLEALRAAGAELVDISPLADTEIPSIDGLYAGGGFPEVHAEALSANVSLREDLKRRIDDGLPVWAECGGLMYLSRAVQHNDVSYPMVGALPLSILQTGKPQGHGYVRARVDRSNPFLSCDTTVSGHEFHYSRLCEDAADLDTVMALERGTGMGAGRDGLRSGAVVASYTHVHAAGLPGWAPGMVAAARGVAA